MINLFTRFIDQQLEIDIRDNRKEKEHYFIKLLLSTTGFQKINRFNSMGIQHLFGVKNGRS